MSLVFILLFVVLTGSYLSPNDLRRCSNMPDSSQAQCEKAEVIIAVSGGDTSARAQAAIDLYKNGWAPLIIFSGAAQDTSGPSNARVMRRLAREQGVPDAAVRIEESSRTTAENALNTATYLNENQMTRAILVTSGYHQRRAFLEFSSQLGPGVELRNSPVMSDSQWSPYWWVTARGWWLAGGELAKIIAFYAGGSR